MLLTNRICLNVDVILHCFHFFVQIVLTLRTALSHWLHQLVVFFLFFHSSPFVIFSFKVKLCSKSIHDTNETSLFLFPNSIELSLRKSYHILSKIPSMEDNNEKSDCEMWSGSGNSLSSFNLEDDMSYFFWSLYYIHDQCAFL